LFAAGLFTLAGNAILAAQDLPLAQLTIRVCNSLRLSSGLLGAARQTAGEILREASLALQWRTCEGKEMIRADLHRDVGGLSDVVLRVIAAPSGYESQTALGFAYIQAHSTSSVLSTVFADRIGALASRLRVAPGLLLGRAMAHEIGHVLLGTATHSPEGLMRANWTSVLIRRNLAADWKFSPKDALRMHATLVARSRLDAAPGGSPAPRLPMPTRNVPPP
jgi:hypothetical protein